MGSIFKKTSVTLVQRMIRDRECVDQAAWMRFDSLYRPAMLKFVEWKRGVRADNEDIVMEVMAKLADAFRNGRYSPVAGVKFRSYLATLLHNQMIMHHRADQARGDGRFVAIENALSLTATEPDIALKLDVDMRLAQHAAATDTILSSPLVSDRDKAVFRALEDEGAPLADVAKRFGIWKNTASQIRSRINRKIAAVEEKFEP